MPHPLLRIGVFRPARALPFTRPNAPFVRSGVYRKNICLSSALYVKLRLLRYPEAEALAKAEAPRSGFSWVFAQFSPENVWLSSKIKALKITGKSPKMTEKSLGITGKSLEITENDCKSLKITEITENH